MRLWFWLLVILPFALFTREAHADVDAFEFQTYPYLTEGKGHLDPEHLNSFVPAGHKGGGLGTSQESTLASLYMTRSAMEFEYGLTDKVDFAYYVNVAVPAFPGAPPQYAGSKFRFHGRLFEENQLPVNIGWYFETEWWNKQFVQNPVEAEWMLILQKDIGRWQFILNAPDTEFAVIGPDRSEGLEVGYRAETRYVVSENLTLAVQGYGSSGPLKQSDPIREQQHYIMPTVWTTIPAPDSWFLGETSALATAIPVELGVGIGLTNFSDRVILRLTMYYGGSGSRARDPRVWWKRLFPEP